MNLRRLPHSKLLLLLLSVLLLPTLLTACPRRAPKSSVTVLLTSNDAPKVERLDKQGPVIVDEIDRLILTICEISLDRSGNGVSHDDPTIVEVSNNAFDPADVIIEIDTTVRWDWTEDGEHTVTSGEFGDANAGMLFDFAGSMTGDFAEFTFDTLGVFPYFSEPDIADGMTGVVEVVEEGTEIPSKEIVFQGELDVNILDLAEVSQIISNADIPAAKYTKIRLTVKNPRLYLASDPETEITNVQLTANGRLFVSEMFTLQEGENQLIILDFGGIHLVMTGNGKYVLTPQLRADITIQDAEAEAVGVIASVDADNDTMQVTVPDGEITVDYASAAIFLPGDAVDIPTGTEADLVVGADVRVAGLLDVNGVLHADVVEILPAP